MADTANSLSEYAGDCPMCGESIFDYDADFTEYQGGVAHTACVEMADEDRIMFEPDWSQE